MPAAKLGQFMEHVRVAAAAHAAVRPALYVAGSCVVRLGGDRLVCNGSVDFMEAELELQWTSGCPGEQRRKDLLFPYIALLCDVSLQRWVVHGLSHGTWTGSQRLVCTRSVDFVKAALVSNEVESLCVVFFRVKRGS
jgi:hypothetical protein